MIKAIDSLYEKDSDGAMRRLEIWLDREAIVFGPNEYHPRKMREEERSILRLIGDHREKHPFAEQNHPGINDMVQKALASAK